MAIIKLNQILHTADETRPLSVGVDGKMPVADADVLTQLDITLSALRDAIADSGGDAKTLNDLYGRLTLIKDTDGIKKITDPLPGSDTFGHGEKDVATAGVAVQLSTDQSCVSADVIAKTDNTGLIYVGSSGVSDSSYGVFLRPDDSVNLSVSNLNLVYIDADTTGEGVTFFYG